MMFSKPYSLWSEKLRAQINDWLENNGLDPADIMANDELHICETVHPWGRTWHLEGHRIVRKNGEFVLRDASVVTKWVKYEMTEPPTGVWS